MVLNRSPKTMCVREGGRSSTPRGQLNELPRIKWVRVGGRLLLSERLKLLPSVMWVREGGRDKRGWLKSLSKCNSVTEGERRERWRGAFFVESNVIWVAEAGIDLMEVTITFCGERPFIFFPCGILDVKIFFKKIYILKK